MEHRVRGTNFKDELLLYSVRYLQGLLTTLELTAPFMFPLNHERGDYER